MEKLGYSSAEAANSDFSRSAGEDVQSVVWQHINTISDRLVVAADAENVQAQIDARPIAGLPVYQGVIQYTIPGYGGYRVALESLGGIKRCRDGRGSGSGNGAELVSLLPPGTDVCVVFSDKDKLLGTIIAARPAIESEASDWFSDFVVDGSGVGLYASPHYSAFVSGTRDGGGAMPFGGDRPLDGLPGDYTVLATTGVGLHIDADMAYLRASELCGLFLFREDGCARLAGETLATESYANRTESGVAGYENFHESGSSIYPWETLGLVTPAELQTVDLGVAAVFNGQQATLEPLSSDATPINRIETYGGYLGQGQLLVLSTPTGDTANRLSVPTDKRGLFREQVLIDGTYLLESARQIFIAKTADVPVIKRNGEREYLAEDEEYRQSGIGEVGDEHIVKQISVTDKVAAVTDLYAYASGWQGLHPAAYHPRLDVNYAQVSSGFSQQLGLDDRVLPPDPENVKIDHRYGEVEIHRILSLFAFLPDGSVVLRNGAGAELKLSGGVVELSGTGVYVNAAKTVSVLAGQVSIRAYKDLEVVSSIGSIRAKAERNLMLLGGNSGTGGVLIESRGVSKASSWPEEPGDAVAAGVVIKGGKSFVGIYGGDVLLKTGPTAADQFTGDIILDAPQNKIISRATAHYRYTTSGFFDNFGDHPERVTRTNRFADGYTMLDGSLGVNEEIIGGGSVQIRDSYTTERGHYASTQSQQYNGLVGVEKEPVRIRDLLHALRIEIATASNISQETIDSYRDNFGGEDLPANTATIRNSRFGFSSSTKYGATQVVLVQPYWQQILPIGTTWNEPTVKYRDSIETLPWPGKERWEAEDGYSEPDGDPKYFDKFSQLPKHPQEAREEYEELTVPVTRRVSIKTGLKTINI